MLFYTQQHINFIKSGNTLLPDTSFEDDYLKQFYPFMKQAYHDRIDSNFNVNNGLIWGWPTREEAFWYYEDMPKSHVIIAADIPAKNILTSDFDAWHMVLNNYHSEHWNHMFDEKELREIGFLEDSEKFTPQLVTSHINTKDIIDVICR